MSMLLLILNTCFLSRKYYYSKSLSTALMAMLTTEQYRGISFSNTSWMTLPSKLYETTSGILVTIPLTLKLFRDCSKNFFL